jgi:hypothetical protein
VGEGEGTKGEERRETEKERKRERRGIETGEKQSREKEGGRERKREERDREKENKLELAQSSEKFYRNRGPQRGRKGPVGTETGQELRTDTSCPVSSFLHSTAVPCRPMPPTPIPAPLFFRGGVLEPEGTVEIKFRKKDLVKAMRRTDPACRKLVEQLGEQEPQACPCGVQERPQARG